jgi:hypothetical protein
MTDDPFRQCDDLTIEFVDAAAGAGKTLTAIAVALDRARHGVKTIFVMPTIELIHEMASFALRPGDVPIVEITSANDEHGFKRRPPITELIRQHIVKTQGGHLLFITHEAANRMGLDWPTETRAYELVIDEAPEVILTRAPFQLRESFRVLTSFLTVEAVGLPNWSRRAQPRKPTDPAEFTKTDLKRMRHFEAIIAGGVEGSSVGEVAQATERLARLIEKFEAFRQTHETLDHVEPARFYSQIVPLDPRWVKRRAEGAATDDIFRYLQPITHWLVQGCCLFADWEKWTRMIVRADRAPDRGRVSISGFRRPDALKAFARVTVMCALFRHTICFHLWGALGVNFVPSSLIRVRTPTTLLGRRKLRIYWLTAGGWSKRTRDQSGGIGAIFYLIRRSGAIDASKPLCVVTNLDDASQADPRLVHRHWPGAEIMPHNSRGQNRFRGFHQLIHCAALNSFTSDIRWMEQVLGINSHTQRIARTGQAIYQSLMRLSLRDPRSSDDVSLICMDRDVAMWLPQWFTPVEQVEVTEIDASGVIRRKGKPGRPSIGDRPMTSAERKARYQLRRNEQRDG